MKPFSRGMTKSPERIWDTVNGASTSLPSGVRQQIGGWSQTSDRPLAVEYVHADLIATPTPSDRSGGNLDAATCLIKDAFEDAGHEVGGTFARRLAAEIMLLAHPPASDVEPTISAIMEQAQVFASTYSLVGGRFDDGSKMAQSNEEKADLERMIRAALAEPEDTECCVACDVQFEDGDLVYWSSDDTGHLHEDCCGPEREAYVNADGSPLQDGEPIPKPFEWRAGR